MQCDACGAEMPDDMEYCGKCGAKQGENGAEVGAGKKQPKHSASKSSIPAYVAVGISLFALVFAVFMAFMLPTHEAKSVAAQNTPRIVDMKTDSVTFAKGSDSASVHILNPNSSYVVVATLVGKSGGIKCITYDDSTGNLIVYADQAQTKRVKREVTWIAYDTSTADAK